jgi:hypothetical protein
MAQSARSYRALREQRARRTAQLAGLAGFVGAAALPVILWHRAIGLMASDFRIDAKYLATGWLGYGLIVLGLVCLLPVLLSIGRRPESKLYPRSRNALAGWGVSCYLLGMVLAVQVAAIASGYGGH